MLPEGWQEVNEQNGYSEKSAITYSTVHEMCTSKYITITCITMIIFHEGDSTKTQLYTLTFFEKKVFYV